jgi:hypothetical protein
MIHKNFKYEDKREKGVHTNSAGIASVKLFMPASSLTYIDINRTARSGSSFSVKMYIHALKQIYINVRRRNTVMYKS